MSEYKEFRRSSTNKVIGGVCGGLGKYFNIDPIVFRLVFTILFFAAGGGLIAYIIAWIAIPGENNGSQYYNHNTSFSSSSEGESKHDYADRDAEIVSEEKSGHKLNEYSGSLIAGLILIAIGLVFFLDNYITIDFDVIWPLAIIAIGIEMMINAISKKNKQSKENE